MRVVWFGPQFPAPPPKVGPAYGNAVFNVPAAFLNRLLRHKGYYCYWIECLKFRTIMAVRYDKNFTIQYICHVFFFSSISIQVPIDH